MHNLISLYYWHRYISTIHAECIVAFPLQHLLRESATYCAKRAMPILFWRNIFDKLTLKFRSKQQAGHWQCWLRHFVLSIIHSIHMQCTKVNCTNIVCSKSLLIGCLLIPLPFETVQSDLLKASCFHRVNWHSSVILTEVFRVFSSVVRQMPGHNSQRRDTASTLPN